MNAAGLGSRPLRRLPLRAAVLQRGYREHRFTPRDVVDELLARIADRGEDHVWLARADSAALRAAADALWQRRADIDQLPLYGLPFSVKDNIDVAGLPTTCGCTAPVEPASAHAQVVQRALDAGALFVGKNTLDQFATGLNGTRSLTGFCRNAFDPRYVPGGSSSGSGVAVAAQLVCFSLGSDTGGSGRVPAAMNHVVGLRPSIGVLSGRGTVYNNRFFDVVPVFAQSVADAFVVLAALRGGDPFDSLLRPDAERLPLQRELAAGFRFGVPRARDLQFHGDAQGPALFGAAVEALCAAGGVPVDVDFSPFVEAGRMVFDSALVVERALSYRPTLERHPQTVHPAVAAALRQADRYTAEDVFLALYRLQAARHAVRPLFEDVEVLLTPTVPRPYTVEELLAEPMARNAELGHYTYGVAPLDLCAIALPAAMRADGLPFGVSLLAGAGQDARLAAVGRRFEAQVGQTAGLPGFDLDFVHIPKEPARR
jgi:allophanate hydrolase